MEKLAFMSILLLIGSSEAALFRPNNPRYIRDNKYNDRKRAHAVELDGTDQKRQANDLDTVEEFDYLSYSECQLNEADKINCGFLGINANGCRSRGCCWQQPENEDSFATPWCYHSTRHATAECTMVKEKERLECGHIGIEARECTEINGCCWMPSEDGNIPFCFTPGAKSEETCGNPAIPPRTTGRIVGGQVARPHSWPWQVSIAKHTEWHKHYCGGSILNQKWILTAAHCQKAYTVPGQKTKNTVVIGMHDEDEVGRNERDMYVEHIIPHEDYDKENDYANDIMLLKLANPIYFNEHVSPICLPEAGYEIAKDTWCYATGWGRLKQKGDKAEILQQVDLPIVDSDTCNKPLWYGGTVNPATQLCAGYYNTTKDTCQGDSGGPLMCYLDGRWQQIGVTSWGKGCGIWGWPGIYAKVSHYVTWIEEKIAQFGEN